MEEQMPIMSLADWKSRTALKNENDNRSRLLRAVDDALGAYHRIKTKQNLENLKTALNTWRGKKGGTDRDADTIEEMQESLEKEKPSPSWTAPPIPGKPKGTPIYLARSFENANSLERDQSLKAFEAARELINKTFQRLNQAKAAGRERNTYERWFGTYDGTRPPPPLDRPRVVRDPTTDPRYQQVLDNIRDIYDALHLRPIVLYYRGASAIGPSDCGFDSGGPEDFFGATWSKEQLEKEKGLAGLNKEYTHVYLGELFYSTASTYSSDSMAGTLIHEFSHAICGTEDIAYQFDPCLELARKPEDAIKNADSYEYLCEDYWRDIWTSKELKLKLPPKAHIKIPMRAPR
jgi:hypothetical protein